MQCKHWEEPPTKRDLYYYWTDGTEAGYLCVECATESGFCPGCGAFVAGIDAEIPSMSSWGMCSECVDDIED